MKITRLCFLLSIILLLPALRLAAAEKGPQLGLQSWTCRNMNFDEVVAFATKHGIKHLQLIASHIDPNGTKEEIPAQEGHPRSERTRGLYLRRGEARPSTRRRTASSSSSPV
jgi:hypothetical protein